MILKFPDRSVVIFTCDRIYMILEIDYNRDILFTMKTYKLSTIVLTMTLSASVFAGRYIVPTDNNVISKFNNNSYKDVSLKHRINILVWNIYKGKIVGWEEDFSSLANQNDLMILQEVFLNPRMERVFKSTSEFDYTFASAWEDTKYSNTKSGVATASRVKPTKIQWQRSYFTEPIVKTPKMTLFTEYALENSDQKLLVGNIHGINFVTAGKLKHMIDRATEVLKKHSGPIVFAGDFNTWTKTKLRIMNESLRKIGMSPVKFDLDTRKRALGKALDHIWIKNLKVIGSKVLSNITTSDHKPLAIEVEL